MRRDDAFDRAFMRLYPRAVITARRILGSHEQAEDAAAEALARTFVRWRRLRELPYLDAWVIRTTINLALDSTRRRGPTAARPDTVDAADAVATRMALVDALRRLPARQREAVALRYLSDLSEADVAAALRCAPGTVKSHLRRGVAALRDSLGTDLEEAPLAGFD